jgi:hypothetical protein
MTPKQLEHFRDLLEAQRQELLASKDGLPNASNRLPESTAVAWT